MKQQTKSRCRGAQGRCNLQTRAEAFLKCTGNIRLALSNNHRYGSNLRRIRGRIYLQNRVEAQHLSFTLETQSLAYVLKDKSICLLRSGKILQQREKQFGITRVQCGRSIYDLLILGQNSTIIMRTNMQTLDSSSSEGGLGECGADIVEGGETVLGEWTAGEVARDFKASQAALSCPSI